MSYSISYIFKALDEFTEPARKISDSVDKLTEKVNKLGGRFNHVGENIRALGKSVSLYLTTPIMGFAALSLHEFDKADKALAQVKTSLKSTGNTAQLSLEQLTKASESLQSKSLFKHTEILSDVTAQLLRFSNIHGQTFLKAQQAIVNFAARTGAPLRGATSLIGRALLDPEKGIQKLNRFLGLTKLQVAVIQHLAKVGQISRAQNLILGGLGKKYGGAAEAQAMAGLGPLQVLKNQFDDILEDFGKEFAKILLPLIPIIKNFIEAFKALSPQTKKYIFLVIALSATIGPLIIGLGILVTAIGAIVSPIGLVVAGIIALTGVLIALHKYLPSWSQVKQGFSKNIVHGGVFGIGQHMNTDGLKALFHGDFHRAAQIYKAHLVININDKNDNVKSVRTTQSGGMHLQVGRNMAHVR